MKLNKWTILYLILPIPALFFFLHLCFSVFLKVKRQSPLLRLLRKSPRSAVLGQAQKLFPCTEEVDAVRAVVGRPVGLAAAVEGTAYL